MADDSILRSQRRHRRRNRHEMCATSDPDEISTAGIDAYARTASAPTMPGSSLTPHHGRTTNANADDSQQPSQTNSAITYHTYLYAFCAALNSCNLGYDLGVSTNVGPLVQADFGLTDGQLERFLGSLNFWSIFGALLSPVVSDRYGRRRTFAVAAVMFTVGIAVMSLSQSFEVLMVGRMIVGLGVGCGEAIDPMYIAEISPANCRGQLVSWAEAGVAVGVVLGFCSSLLFYGREVDGQWRYMLFLGTLMPLIMLVLVRCVIPESPRWLLCQNQDDEAKAILTKTHPPGTDVDWVVERIKESLEIERAASTAVGWRAILLRPSPAIRRMLLVGVGISIIQQAVGIDAIMFYLLLDIREAGITSELGQTSALIFLGVVKLAFVFVGAHLFDRYGRRPLLLISLLGCAISLIVVSITFTSETHASKAITISALAVYLAFFSSGIGPGNWVVVSEVFATSIRAKAMSVAIFPNRVTATLLASTFLSVANAISWPGFFAMLSGICAFSAIFLAIYLPETKGKSLEDMAVYFAQITSDRSILDVEEKLLCGTCSLELVEPQNDDDDDDGFGGGENGSDEFIDSPPHEQRGIIA